MDWLRSVYEMEKMMADVKHGNQKTNDLKTDKGYI